MTKEEKELRDAMEEWKVQLRAKEKLTWDDLCPTDRVNKALANIACAPSPLIEAMRQSDRRAKGATILDEGIPCFETLPLSHKQVEKKGALERAPRKKGKEERGQSS